MKTLDDHWCVSGTVHVALKDKVPPSNACQHAKELVDIVRANYSEDGVSAKDPIIILYSDGRPDHRTTLKSMKIAAIYIFMALDLDANIAACTALNQSCRNPAEYVMSMLNLGLQNVATARESGTNKRNQNEEFRNHEEY